MEGRADLSRLSIARYEPGPVGALVGCATKLSWLAGVCGVLVIAYAEADRRELIPWKAKPQDAKADLALAEEALAQYELRAPFKGTVTAKHAEVGEPVGGFVPGAGGIPSGAVVTITDLSAPEIEADVPESRVLDLALQQPADVE